MRFNRRSDFKSVLRSGEKIDLRGFTIYYRTGVEGIKLGLIIPSSFGKAVVRNRVRRCLQDEFMRIVGQGDKGVWMIVRFYGRSERSKLTRSDIKALRAELKSAVNDIIAKSNEAGGRKSGGNFASEIFVIPVRLYQILLSPMFPPSCRFSPSCSEYAIEALRKYGIIRGSLKAVWRVLRCNPFSAGGYDPA